MSAVATNQQIVVAEPSHEAGRPGKRMRHHENFDWRIRISAAATFRTFIGVLKEILINCNFYLEKTDTFQGVCVDSVDPSIVCMVKARFECTIESEGSVEGESFCVPMETLKTLLKDSGDMMEIVRYPETAPDIFLHSYDRKDPLNCTTSRMRNIDDGGLALPMDAIGSQHIVEIELPDLKSMVKTARDLKATHMRFTIEVPATRDADGILEATHPDENGIVHTFFTIGIETESAGMDRTFHSVTQVEIGEDGEMTIRALSTAQDDTEENTKFDNLVEKFNELYSTTYLDLMLKSMDRERVQLFMAKEMPLIVKYGLGSDMSYLKVILAPKNSISDDTE